MDKLKKRKRQLLAVAVISAVTGAASIAGIIASILMLWYVPMFLCIAITAHGFYGCPFYFIAYANMKKCEILVSEIQRGETELEVIASRAGIKVDFAKKLIKKSVFKGYIDGTMLPEKINL